MGLRQIFPVQTKRTFFKKGCEWTGKIETAKRQVNAGAGRSIQCSDIRGGPLGWLLTEY